MWAAISDIENEKKTVWYLTNSYSDVPCRLKIGRTVIDGKFFYDLTGFLPDVVPKPCYIDVYSDGQITFTDSSLDDISYKTTNFRNYSFIMRDRDQFSFIGTFTLRKTNNWIDDGDLVHVPHGEKSIETRGAMGICPSIYRPINNEINTSDQAGPSTGTKFPPSFTNTTAINTGSPPNLVQSNRINVNLPIAHAKTLLRIVPDPVTQLLALGSALQTSMDIYYEMHKHFNTPVFLHKLQELRGLLFKSIDEADRVRMSVETDVTYFEDYSSRQNDGKVYLETVHEENAKYECNSDYDEEINIIN